MKTMKSVFFCILVVLIFNTSPLTAYASSSPDISSERYDTIEDLKSLNKLIDKEKEKFSTKNTATRIYIAYLELLNNTVDFILEDAVPAAYERGYSGEQIGNLKDVQNSIEDLLADNRQDIADYKKNDLLSKIPYVFTAKKIRTSADTILSSIDTIDITLLLYDLYYEGWIDGRENYELPQALTYKELINNQKTIVNDITDYIMSEELSKRLRDNVINTYDGNKEIYVSKDGTRQHYSIPTSGYADTDFVFYTHKYNASGNILKKNYFSASQCAGLASLTYSKLFSADYCNRDGLSQKKLENVKMTDLNDTTTLYDLFVSNGIDTGAHLRSKNIKGSGGHSIIILSYNEEKILIYEANFDAHYGVRYACMDWATFIKYFFKNGSRMISYAYMPNNYKEIINGVY